MPVISAEKLTRFAAAVFEKIGVGAHEAAICANSLVGANLRGYDSHGVMRVPQYVGFLEKGDYRTGVELLVEPGVLAAGGGAAPPAGADDAALTRSNPSSCAHRNGW